MADLSKTLIRKERCESCLYRLRYPMETRQAILGKVAARGTYVSCHYHDNSVVCRGFYDDEQRANGCALLRLTRKLAADGREVIELVEDGQYPKPDDDDDEQDY